VAGDTNGTRDVFAHDRQSHTTVRLSVNAAGVEGNSHSTQSDVTPDGRFVVFCSGSDNLVPGDTNGVNDIFVVDRDTDMDGIFDEPGQTAIERASVNSSGVQNNGGAGWPSITPDGRFVTFNSRASNLVPVDFNYQPDVFIHDRTTGTTIQVTTGLAGPTDDQTFWTHVSGDGQYVAFHSYATNLVAGDTNGYRDVFRRELAAPLINCDGDMNHDGDVGIPDFLALQAAWGTSPGGPPDLDRDGVVGIADMLKLLGNWGACQ
jgi:Tol biopolymer transport system component